MAGSAVCQGKRVSAAAAGSLLQGRSLPRLCCLCRVLRCSAHPLRRSGSSLDSLLHGEGPSFVGSAVIYEQPSTSHHLVDLSRKMPWSDQETRTLLEIWGEDGVQLTLRGCLKNRHVFEYVSEKMNDRGFIRTSEQCYTRIKRLKHGFLHEKEDFKFFGEMETIFRKELKVDDSVAETSVIEEPEEFVPEPSPKKVTSGSQWSSDSSKLPWGDGETEALLDIWGSEEIQENLKGCTKNKHIFIQISEVMASQGYMRTPEQCQSRIKRLRANFRHFLEGRKGEKQECKYFDQLVQIFGTKYVMNSDPLADDTAEVIES